MATTPNMVRAIEKRPRRAASWIADTNRCRSTLASWPVSTRSSARLDMEKQPAGAGLASGFHVSQCCVIAVLSTSSRPAARARSVSRRPTVDARRRGVCIAARTRRRRSSSPTSRSNVDQSVSISASRPPGRSTRAISPTASAGSASHCKVRSDRTASNEPSGSASAKASPVMNRHRHRAERALSRAAATISAETSSPTISPRCPTSAPRAMAASPSPQPTSSNRCPGDRPSVVRSHERSPRVASQRAVASIVASRTDTFGSSSTRW